MLINQMDQNQRWAILKFGGTSVSSLTNWKNILRVIQKRRKEGYSICIVHSALKGVSNLLEQVIRLDDEQKALEIVDEIKQRHLTFASDLGVGEPVLLSTYFIQLKELAIKWTNRTTADVEMHARILALG